jgi:chaperonin GroES
MNIKPLGDRVIIKRAEEEKTTAGGIIIPDSASEKPSKGEVLAVGSKCEEVSVGNNVFFESYATKEISDGDNKYLVVKEEDITAVIS